MALLNGLEKETKAIIEDVATIAIYASQSYDQVWSMSHEEKQIFVKILKDKINFDRNIKPKDVLTQGRF